MATKSRILILSHGPYVVLTKPHTDGWWDARVLWAPAQSPYQPEGYDLAISPEDIAESREVCIDDELAVLLAAKSTPTYESTLLVIGGVFTLRDDEDDYHSPTRRWTITELVGRGYEIIAEAEDGTIERFPSEIVRRARTLQQAIDGMSCFKVTAVARP